MGFASAQPGLADARVWVSKINNLPEQDDTVAAGHSRPKDGVASARLCPAIHAFLVARLQRRGCPAGHDRVDAKTSAWAGAKRSPDQPAIRRWEAAFDFSKSLGTSISTSSVET